MTSNFKLRSNSVKILWILGCCLLFILFFWAIPAHAGVLSNDELTISVGNQQSWTGRNGTGNLSYYGCDKQCQCIYLTGGKISCRDGVCQTIWRNKNFSYTLSSPIARPSDYGQTANTLIISTDSQIISQNELYPKTFDNVDSGN